MEMHYLNFCHPGDPFYEQSPLAVIDYPAVSEPLPQGWTRRFDSEWVHLVPPRLRTPAQGWKIHVSATLDNAERILSVVLPYCLDGEIMCKFIRGRGILGRRNSKYGDRSASGKFITIYPADEAELEKVLTQLGDALEGEQGPYILSDLRYRQGPLYVRYGGFVLRQVRDANGQLVHAIEDPDGRLVPDVRGFSFKMPSWVTLPACLAESLAARNAGTLKGFPFRATRALHFSNGGGVYEATDIRTGETVLLKEGRPLAGIDEAGRDAVTRLERERWALDTLAGLDCIPRLIDYRIGYEHYFLAREYVTGRSLVQEIHTRNPLINPDSTVGHAAYTEWALNVLDQVEAGMRAMHERGVVFADLHPNNIMVRDDGRISFIDLETASEVRADLGQNIGAPGYRAPLGYRGVAVDEYALGCLRLGIFLPLTITLSWGPQQVRRLLDEITAEFPVPADFADRVWADLGAEPYPGVADPRTAADAPPLSLPEHRQELVEALYASATPERDDRLFPGDVAQFRIPGAGYTLAFGAAGVLWAVPEDATEEHIDWVLRAVERDRQARVGAYDGLAGVAYALDSLGRTEPARDLLDRALAVPLSELNATLFAGLPGLGLVVLRFLARTADEGLLKRAIEIADALAERGDGIPAGPGRGGLLHGPSGVSLFLTRLFDETNDPALLERAAKCIREDLAATDARNPLFGGGAAGVGLALAELLDRAPDNGLATVRDGIIRTLANRFVMNSGLFRGRAGIMLALRRLDDGGARTGAALRAHLDALRWHLVPVNERPHVLGDHNLRMSMDLGSGAAGVLLAADAAAGGTLRLPLLDV